MVSLTLIQFKSLARQMTLCEFVDYIDLSLIENYGSELLIIAAAKGNLPIVQYLIEEYNVSPHTRSMNGEYQGKQAIEVAITFSHYSVVVYLAYEMTDMSLANLQTYLRTFEVIQVSSRRTSRFQLLRSISTATNIGERNQAVEALINSYASSHYITDDLIYFVENLSAMIRPIAVRTLTDKIYNQQANLLIRDREQSGRYNLIEPRLADLISIFAIGSDNEQYPNYLDESDLD